MSTAKEAEDYAKKMIGHRLITKQTGDDGKLCSKVLLMERIYLRKETYFAILYDRQWQGPILVGSPRGGTVRYLLL